MQKLAKECSGKKILLIGNAASALREKRQVDELYDIIVRMNLGFPEGKEEYIGSRTDVWATSIPLEPEEIERCFSPTWVLWMSSKQMYVSANNAIKEFFENNAIFYPKERWETLKNRLGKRPTTGAMVVDFFTELFNCEVDLLGFDFFETNTWYWGKDNSKHYGKMYAWEKEKEFILNIKNIKRVLSGKYRR